jgi:PhnB protein
MYKPEGYNSLSPYIIVGDAQALLDFLKAVFDAEPFFVHRDDGGEMSHIEIRIDDTVLMIGQMPGAESEAHVHVYVRDVDDAFARARAAGGTVVQEPVRKQDADRRGGIADPTGTVWWLSTQQEPRG